MTSEVSRFCPPTLALALPYEHWHKTTWANRSPSGILFLKRVNGVPHREIGRDAHGRTQVFRPESPLPFACAEGLICFIIVKSVWHFSAHAFFSLIPPPPSFGLSALSPS